MGLVSYNYYKCFYYINVSITTLIFVINIAIVIIVIKSDNYLLQFVSHDFWRQIFAYFILSFLCSKVTTLHELK